MTVYTGQAPFADLTDDQIKAIEAASTWLVPGPWRDGVWRGVEAELGGADNGPWPNPIVKAAIITVLENVGATNPYKLDTD